MAQASTWRVMVNFSANNLTGGAFSSLMSSISKAHSSTQNLQNAINALKIAGGAALVDFGKQGIDVFTKSAEAAGNMQQQLVLMKQTLSGMGDTKAMAALAAQRNLLTTGSNPVLLNSEEIAGIQRNLLGAGIKAGDITNGGSKSLGVMATYLAEIEQARGLGNPEQTSSNIAGFLKGYGIAGGATAAAIDRFQKDQSLTHDFGTDRLRYGEQYAGQTARALHISPSDFIDALALQAQQNVGASKAGVNLNDMLLAGIKPGGMTNAEMDIRRTTLARVGLLGRADPHKAGLMLKENEAAFKKAGYDVSSSSLSPKQRESLATYFLSQSSTSTYMDMVKKHGLVQGSTEFMGQIHKKDYNQAHRMGYSDEWANQRYVDDVRNIFGVQGMRAALSFGPDSKKFIDQANKQSSVDKLIAELRGTLPNQEKFAQSRLTDILIGLGGVDQKTGIAIKGGPLDTLQKVMTELNNFLISVEKFTQDHPDAAAHIGQAIGLIGVAAAVAGTVIAGAGVIGLGSAVLGVGGRAVMGGVAHSVGAMFPHFAQGRSLGIGRQVGRLGNWAGHGVQDAGSRAGNAFSHWSGAHAYLNDQIVHPEDARRIAQFGRVAVPNPRFVTSAALDAEKIGLPKLVNAFRMLTPWIARIASGALTLALKFADVVGWIFLAVDAFRFFAAHPDIIAKWIAEVILLFKNTLIPGFKTGIMNIGKWLLGYLQDLLTMLNPLNWHKAIDWGKSVAKMVQDDLNAASNGTKPGPGQVPGKVAPKHDPHNRQKTAEHVIHNTINLDGKKIYEATEKHRTRSMGRAVRQSPGGLGTPGISHSVTGNT